MSMRGKCLQEGSGIFVVYQTTRHAEPLLDRLWWPVDTTRSVGAHRLVGHEVVASHSSEPFRIAPEDPDFWQLNRFTAYVDPRAQARKVETEQVLAPKVRKGTLTRWHQGRWQRLLKSGWCD